MNVHEPSTSPSTSTEHGQPVLPGTADTSAAPAGISNRDADDSSQLPCSFFLRTGTCAYVSYINIVQQSVRLAQVSMQDATAAHLQLTDSSLPNLLAEAYHSLK
jgi:hypothetical protein